MININTKELNIIKDAFKFWSHLSEEEENFLVNHLIKANYSKGEIIHGRENDCLGLIFVKKGSLRVHIISEEGREVTLYRLDPEEICTLSASCILDSINFDIHIEAEEDSELILLDVAAFSKLSKKNIYVENFSYKIAAERFSDVMWAMQQILFMSFDKRLASFLLDESSKNNSDTIKLTHEQIAKYTGSAREVVSRMLKYFSNENIVELFRGGIKIIDKPKLKSKLK